MTRADIIRFLAARVGCRVRVTNHYITRADHPCFGTRERTIVGVNGSSLCFDTSGRVSFPCAAQLRMQANTIMLFGGGIGQKPNEPFLTIDMI